MKHALTITLGSGVAELDLFRRMREDRAMTAPRSRAICICGIITG
jgi:hypothetical protein